MTDDPQGPPKYPWRIAWSEFGEVPFMSMTFEPPDDWPSPHNDSPDLPLLWAGPPIEPAKPRRFNPFWAGPPWPDAMPSHVEPTRYSGILRRYTCLIIDLYLAGIGPQAIAAHVRDFMRAQHDNDDGQYYFPSHDNITYLLRRVKLMPEPGPRRTEYERQRWLAAYKLRQDDGWTFQRIGDRLGVTKARASALYLKGAELDAKLRAARRFDWYWSRRNLGRPIDLDAIPGEPDWPDPLRDVWIDWDVWAI